MKGKGGPGRPWSRLSHVISATQGGRQERHTSLIKAMFSSSGFASGCHVNSEEELGTRLVEVHRKSNLESRRKTHVLRGRNFFHSSLWKGFLVGERAKKKGHKRKYNGRKGSIGSFHFPNSVHLSQTSSMFNNNPGRGHNARATVSSSWRDLLIFTRRRAPLEQKRSGDLTKWF